MLRSRSGVLSVIANHVYELVTDDVFLRLTDLLPACEIFVKIEGFNPAGSIKLKPAVALIEDAEAKGLLRPGGRVIESSSGNFGIALSVVCASKGYRFTCVTDPNAAEYSTAMMRALGADVVVVDQRDANGGFLGSRIAYLNRRLAEDPGLVWPNQYANPANPRVHWTRTAASILRELGPVDFLFVGAGTTGTLVGCAGYFRRFSPQTTVIAVDTVGSVTFGNPAGPRFIPGLGTSRVPEICRTDELDEIVLVAEADAVAMCRTLATRHGLLAGGSTGSVLAAVVARCAGIPAGARIATIAPDMGDKYLPTVYDDAWGAARFSSSPRPSRQPKLVGTA